MGLSFLDKTLECLRPYLVSTSSVSVVVITYSLRPKPTAPTEKIAPSAAKPAAKPQPQPPKVQPMKPPPQPARELSPKPYIVEEPITSDEDRPYQYPSVAKAKKLFDRGEPLPPPGKQITVEHFTTDYTDDEEPYIPPSVAEARLVFSGAAPPPPGSAPKPKAPPKQPAFERMEPEYEYLYNYIYNVYSCCSQSSSLYHWWSLGMD